MKSSDRLTRAKQFIGTPDKWCQGRYSIDGKYCVVAACAETSLCIGMHFIEAEAARRGFDRVAAWNDHDNTTHADIMDGFDRAIAAALAEGD